MKTSNSEVETFLDCKRRWWLTYVLELGTKGADSQPLFAGNLVHAGVEAFRNLRYMQDGTIADATAAGNDAIQAMYDDTELSPELLPKDTIDLALIMFEGYVDWLEEEAVDFGLVYNGVEIEISTPLMPGVEWLAKLDALVWNQTTESFEVIDTKTVQSLQSYPALMQMDMQLQGYVWAAREYTGERVRTAQFDMLRKVKRTASSKPPFYGRVSVSYNEAEISSWLYRTKSTVHDMMKLRTELEDESHTLIEAAQIATPRPNPECSWKCSFVNVCPLFNDGSRVGDMLDEQFVHINPIARYTNIGVKP